MVGTTLIWALFFQSGRDVLLLGPRRLLRMLRRVLLNSMTHDIDDTFLLAGVGIFRYAHSILGQNTALSEYQ